MKTFTQEYVDGKGNLDCLVIPEGTSSKTILKFLKAGGDKGTVKALRLAYNKLVAEENKSN